jgi:hypothetical protein
LSKVTVNELFGTSITSEAEMQKWIDDRKPVPIPGQDPGIPANGEEMSVARVGTDLYEKVKMAPPNCPE